MPEHLAVMEVRFGQLIAQEVERIGIDSCMQLNPVLIDIGNVRPFMLWPLSAAEPSCIGGNDDLPLRQLFDDEGMEPLPYPQPAMAAVVLAQDSRVMDRTDVEVYG